MNPRQQALWVRRLELLQRSQVLRDRLVQHSQALAPAFARAEQVRGGWTWLRQHPGWCVAAGAVLLVLRPRRVWRWSGTAWTLWRTWARARSYWQQWRQRMG